MGESDHGITGICPGCLVPFGGEIPAVPLPWGRGRGMTRCGVTGRGIPLDAS